MQDSNTQRTLLFPSVIGLCMLAIILAFSSMPLSLAYAVTSEEKFAEAEAIIQRIDVLQTDLNQAEADFDAATQEHEAATKAMKAAQERIKSAEKRIAELQDRLAGRASSMYKSGPTTFFDFLLGAQSFEEFLTSWDMIEKISSQDAELVQETKDAREEAEAARKEYASQQEIAAEKMKTAEDLKTQIAATQASLKEEAEKITAEAMELQAKEELEAEQARQAAAAAEAAAAALEAARQQQATGGPSGSAGASVVSGSGTFSHPCPSGSISSSFGWRSFDNAFHQGTDFAAVEGTPYYAADSGTVIYATYDGGYNGGAGNWIVISHGNGIVTKYMHSSAVYVSVGQRVEKGENIGAVGNTGNSFGAHLHFQVEVSGTAVDAMMFL